MQIVIDIPKEMYATLNNIPMGSISVLEALYAIKNGTPLPRWISVRERMPKDRQMVLFCDIEGDIKIGYHIKGRPDTHFSQDGTFDDIKNVKAWMPLPEAHEEKEETE